MGSSQIVCPKCRSTLNKPPQLDMLSEIKKGGGSFMAFGDPNDTLVCPACGCRIRIGDIIDGKHDASKGSWVETILTLGVLAVIVALLAKCFA